MGRIVSYYNMATHRFHVSNGVVPRDHGTMQYQSGKGQEPAFDAETFGTRINAMLGPKATVTETTPHSTTGIPYSIAGSAVVIQQVVGAHLAGATPGIPIATFITMWLLHVFLCNYCYVYLACCRLPKCN
jgi:hypothetical protein